MRSHTKIFLFPYFEYDTIKKDLKNYSVNPLYFIFGNVNEYLQGINWNKYVTLVPANENQIWFRWQFTFKWNNSNSYSDNSC